MGAHVAGLQQLGGSAGWSAENPTYSLVSSIRIGGQCRVLKSAEPTFNALTPEQIRLVIYAIFDLQQDSPNPLISSDFIHQVVKRGKPHFEAICINILRFIDRSTTDFGGWLDIEPHANDNLFLTLQTLTLQESSFHYGSFTPGTMYFLNFLKSESLIDWAQIGNKLRLMISAKGLIRIQQTLRRISAESQAFVAMWFSPETELTYDLGIAEAVRDAGFHPFRIDRHHFENKVDDEILAQIRSSRFLISDFTCGSITTSPDVGSEIEYIVRGGVYFEAGFALGLGIPVIWTVKRDSIKALHFDTNHYPHIVCESESDLREKLFNRIVALIGKGPIET